MKISTYQDDNIDQVLQSTRVLSGIIVPVLLAAFVMLFLFPNDTGELFAWPISPPMSAMMLGATYLGGAYFFTRAALASSWHTVALGFLPVTAFAGILGITTVLHWDRFTQGHISFVLWAFLYFTLPFVIPIFYFRNQRVNQREVRDLDATISDILRWAFGVLGSVLTLVSLVLLLFPELMIPTWPWQLTSLTARVLSAMFVLSGLVEIGVARDGRWSSARIPLQSQALSIGLILLALIRAQDEVAWSKWESWFFVVGLLLSLALIGWGFLQSRKSRVAPPLS